MIKQISFFLSLIVAGWTCSAGLVITDPGFEGITFTDVGDPFTQADSANFDKWVFKDDTGTIPREWSIESSGGNPGYFANGTFGNSSSYKRTMLQAVTDDKATTGLMDLSFDLNLLNAEGGSQSVVVGVWGVETISGATFSFDTAPGPTFGADTGDAVSLATQSYTANTGGWAEQTISNIDLGTGYDLVIIAFQSNNYSQNSTVGIDNVSLVPEPSSIALLGIAGLVAFALRRRR